MIDEASFDIFRRIYDFIPTESDLWTRACKSTHACPPMSACCMRACAPLSTSEETNNNGTAHCVHPHRSRIQRQRMGEGGGVWRGGGLG